MFAPFIFLHRFVSWCIDGIYSRHYILDFSLFYSTIKWWKVLTLYVRITTPGCLILQINIHWWKINRQYFTFVRPIFNDISIETHKWVIGGRNIQHSMSALHWKKHRFMKKDFTRDITNIYVKTFVNYILVWFLIYRWNIQPTLYTSFLTIIFNNRMMKFAKMFMLELPLLGVYFCSLTFIDEG